MKTVEADHGTDHAFFIQLVVVCMKLLQQVHQSLLPGDLSLVLPEVDVLCIGHLFNLEQLISLDHHFVHFKGAVVLIEHEIPFCLDDFIVAPPHSVVTITNPPNVVLFQRSHLARLQEAYTFLWSFLWVDLTAASLVS